MTPHGYHRDAKAKAEQVHQEIARQHQEQRARVLAALSDPEARRVMLAKYEGLPPLRHR